MKRHWAYAKYFMRHKWFVWLASFRVGCSPWLAIIHDWSKLRPSEWLPYAETFYSPAGRKQYIPSPEFARAWNHHQKRNKHHYQYWMLTWDKGTTDSLMMPRKYMLEMIADWMGAGRAITGQWDVASWYEKNKHNIHLDQVTRYQVECVLEQLS